MTSLPPSLGDPWTVLDAVLDGPLHPGGYEATDALLDRAGVDAGTRLLDVGCGAGGALERARDRDATAIGVDHSPAVDPWSVRGEMTTLPVATDSVDVVLGECVLCLADSLPDALAEVRRVLGDDGRLALSDVVVDGDPPDLPPVLAEALCLTGRRDETHLRETIADAGFAVGDGCRHREDLLAMRDQFQARVDYEGLLGALGEEGERTLEGIDRLEAAVEDGTVGYVSLVADAV